MIAHVEGDDFEFLELVDEDARKKELEREEELQKELETFRNHVVKVDEPAAVPKLLPVKPALVKKDFQKSALSHIVKKRKSSEGDHTTEAKSTVKEAVTSAKPAVGKPAALLALDYGSSDEE